MTRQRILSPQRTRAARRAGADEPPVNPLAELVQAELVEWNAVQTAIRARVGPEPEALSAYRTTFERTVTGPGAAVTLATVFNVAARSDLVLIGDYHTLEVAQRTALVLVRALARRRSVVLGLEMVRTEHQSVLDAYMAGSVSEAALRNLIRYDAAWPFPWASYGPILALGREGIELLALDGRGSLERRDRLAAERLVGARSRRPEALCVALVGDLHLAPAHLPGRLAELRPEDRLTVVHQNLPAVHRHLAAQPSGRRAPAADLGGGHFCLVTTTPLARERSYLAWLEGGEDLAEEPLAEVVRAENRLRALLGLGPASAESVELEVHVRGAAGFLRALADSGATFSRLIAVRRQINERGVAVAGVQGPLFIGRADSEHYAAAAAALLQARAGEPLPAPDRPDPAGREADLCAAVRRETFAVLAWRLLEPLSGTMLEPLSAAFDPAAGPAPVQKRLKVERRARLLRARVAAHLAGRGPFKLPPEILAEPATVRAAIARMAGRVYADGLHDALVLGRVRPQTAAALLAAPGPAGRARERRALLALATLARAARQP
jgi:hypothetical protein